MKTILVLGSTGMVGHIVYDYLSVRKDFDVINVAYRKPLNASTILIDLTDRDSIVKFINKNKFHVIINCVGILIKGSKSNPSNAIYINSYLPHLLSELVNNNQGKLIHISTDCVFSGIKGNYLPDDIKDAQDIYGLSKSLGEIVNQHDLTIRTSVIGPEIKSNGEGLLDWFLTQTGKTYGYLDSFWSGITTLQLAKIIEQSIDKNLTGLLQYSNGLKISKFELLKIFQKIWHKNNVEIIPHNGKKIDKSLIPTYPQKVLQVPDYETMCHELFLYMNIHPERYVKYSS